MSAERPEIASLDWRGAGATGDEDLLIRGVHAIDPRSELDRDCDIVIRAGRIAAITEAGDGELPDGGEEIDAGGLHAFPAFFDPHVHLRTPGQEYRFLASLHGVDYLPAEPRFGVVYELLNMPRVERLRVRAAIDDPGRDELPEIDSCVPLFATAEFQEREAYEFFGIVFRGHPDLRRILLPEDYVGWPQRRDFPVGGEPVIFTHSEREVPRWYA